MGEWRDLALAMTSLSLVGGWLYFIIIIKVKLDVNTDTLKRVEDKLKLVDEHETKIAVLESRLL